MLPMQAGRAASGANPMKSRRLMRVPFRGEQLTTYHTAEERPAGKIARQAALSARSNCRRRAALGRRFRRASECRVDNDRLPVRGTVNAAISKADRQYP
jgi:hypothetical protein